MPETLETWQPDPSRAEAEASNPSPDLLDLVSRRAAIIGRAQEQFEDRVDGKRDPRLAEILFLLLVPSRPGCWWGTRRWRRHAYIGRR